MARKRYWEIDSLRGVGVISMILYHLFWNLGYFSDFPIETRSGVWLFFGLFIASTFIFLVGLSLHLSYSRVKDELSEKELTFKYLKRGLKIFSLGLFITFATPMVFPRGYIIFGILHFIGISIILARPLLEFKKLNLVLGVGIILLGIFLQKFSFSSPWLLWSGLRPRNFRMIDYFPLLPWFGLVLVGIFAGKLLYPGFKRKYQIPDYSNSPLIKPLTFFGRNSLKIYFLHEPLILLFLKFSL